MSSFVTWVNDWFRHPGTPQTPTHDRMMCYMCAVLMIGDRINKDKSKDNLRKIHDLLTYTLLGWHPVTAWPKRSEYVEDEKYAQVFNIDELLYTVKILMDFETSEAHRSGHTGLLSILVRMNNAYSSKSSSRYIGEIMTNLMLGMWLLNRNATIPAKNRTIVRACLDLYYTSEKYAVTDIDSEYAQPNVPLKYGPWLNKLIDYLLYSGVSTKELYDSLAYVGWFMSLIRTSRMMKLMSRTEDWKQGVATMLNSEVQRLTSILDNWKMNVYEDHGNDNADVCRGSILFRIFKIRPPRVKILPVG